MAGAVERLGNRGLDRAATLVPQDDEQRRVQVRAAYCSVPAIEGPRTFPATRMMNNSPNAASNTSSGGTRLSLQPRIVA